MDVEFFPVALFLFVFQALFICACMISHFSRVRLSVTLWTVAHQAPLSMGFSRQEYWSGLPCLPPRDYHYVGSEPASLMSPALTGGFFTWEVYVYFLLHILFHYGLSRGS